MNSFPTPPPQDPNDSPDSRAQKIKRIWIIARGIYILATLGLVFYWDWKHIALPAWICEFQSEVMFPDYCYTGINFGFSVIALFVPLFIVQWILQKITGLKLGINRPTKPF
ncbi:MAG TPA: hypothetical protein VK826_16950 [Bacteroidia bacterium]|nr:hypothetical protein [Bacteroidia bacterium]